MRFPIWTLVTLSMASPAGASKLEDSCNTAALIAEKVMTVRQNGASLSEVLSIFEGDTPTDRGGRAMAKEAFSLPRYTTEKHQTLTVQEFRTRWHLKCLNLESID